MRKRTCVARVIRATLLLFILLAVLPLAGQVFPGPTNFSVGISPVAADFNGDGKPDLAMITSAGIQVLLSTGGGHFSAPIPVNSPGCTDAVAAGDFAGDNKLDLIAACAGVIRVFLGNGDGTFRSGATYSVNGSSPVAIRVADFNGDGFPDLVLLNGSVSILLNRGDGSFTAPAAQLSLPQGLVSNAVAVGDMFTCFGAMATALSRCRRRLKVCLPMHFLLTTLMATESLTLSPTPVS